MSGVFFILLICKHTAAVSVICRMAECEVTVQPASHSPAAMRLFAAFAAIAVAYGRAPYVKSQNHVLICKHTAAVSVICRMAELLRKILAVDAD